MNPLLTATLDQILAKHQPPAYVRRVSEMGKNIRSPDFFQRFDQMAVNTISPAALDFAGELEKRGHQLEVNLVSTVHPKRGWPTVYGGVFTHFYPGGKISNPACTPAMRFVPGKAADDIQIFARGVDPKSGKRNLDLGSYALGDVNPEFVQAMLVQLIDGGLAFSNYVSAQNPQPLISKQSFSSVAGESSGLTRA